ncbi:diguanylate cyclase [Thalassotalea atypica]|uniref:diguanylate cyclase n=1 Tax=Thalassotalea atypica TaxID=2054316 RepID=UPI0025729CB8|nr:diguanylate cyclase [Thalassotalea atypica]
MNKILAVDDAQDTLLLLEFDLQAEGYDVITAKDGETALVLLEQHDIDLVLLDLYMPGLSGLDTLKKLKSQSKHLNTPVIMLSASDDENQIVSALELGANDYITKPYIPKVLLARLKTSLRLLEKTLKLESLAKTDFLTNVNNKRNFENLAIASIKQMCRTNNNVTIAMLDIDYFKSVNDNYGHDVGNEVLKLFASTMKKEFRQYDIIGRVGGEEFAVCMPNTNLKEGFNACERFRKVIESLEVAISHEKISFTVSIGLASVCHNEGHYDFNSLMKVADKFLYQAKETSRNCTRSYDEIHNQEHDVVQTFLANNIDQDTLNGESAIDGIDFEIGVNNVLGDEALFKDILQMFFDDHSNDSDKIQQAIAEHDQASMKHLVHTLKGVACSVGAMQLFDNAKKLDAAVNEEQVGKYQSLFDDVSFELNRVINGIIGYLKITQ